MHNPGVQTMSDGSERPRVQDIHKKKLSKMGRRCFSKTLLGLGFSATTAATITAEDVRGASSDQVPISIGLTTDETKNVPADWYNDYQQAERVNQRVRFIDRHTDIVGQWLVPGDYGGKNSRINVEIRMDSTANPRGVIPEQVEGVPIEVTEVGERKPVDGCHGGDDYGSDVPGGVQVASPDGGGSGGPRVLNTDDDVEYFGTCQHIYDTCGSNTEGRKLYHPYGGDSVGKVETALNFEDFVAVNTNSSHDPLPKIAKPDSTPSDPSYFDITDSFTKDSLSDRKAAGKGVRKVGVASCQTFGDLKQISGTVVDDNTCTGEKKGQVQWGQDNDVTSGDSGSVAFAEENGNWYVSSLVNGQSPTDAYSYVFGTGIYRIKDKSGYYYG